MFYKLIGIFKKFTFYTKRLISPFLNDARYKHWRRAFFWMTVLSVQIAFCVKVLETLIPRTQTLLLNRQQNLASEGRIQRTKKSIDLVKRSPQTVEKILETLPEAKDNYNLLDFLNTKAANNQISLLEINFLPTQKSNIPGLLEQRLDVKLQGKFENIFNFLEELKENPRPTVSEKLNLNAQENKLPTGNIRVDVVIRTYLLEPN